VITTFNGKPVRAARELTDSVAATPVGQTARVELIRNGQHETVDVQLVERPRNVVASTQPPQGDDQEGEAQQGRLGIQGKTVTPETIDQMKLKLKTPSGVFVGAVQPDSPAADARLQHGDVIHGFDRMEIKTVENLAEAARSVKPGRYLLEVERNGHTIFLTVTLE
jgi:serine protease Do